MEAQDCVLPKWKPITVWCCDLQTRCPATFYKKPVSPKVTYVSLKYCSIEKLDKVIPIYSSGVETPNSGQTKLEAKG